MPKINRRNEIRRILEKAGIYDAKLECQIALTVRQEQMLERLHKELDKVNFISLEYNASGMEKQVVNPLVPYVLKLEAQLQDSYTALGLNYHATPSKIRESTKPEDKEESALNGFLNGLKG